MLFNERERQGKALDRWQEQQKEWASIKTALAKYTHRSSTLFGSIHHHRQKEEELGMLRTAVPGSLTHTGGRWENTLRGGGTGEHQLIEIGGGYPYALHATALDPTQVSAGNPNRMRVIPKESPPPRKRPIASSEYFLSRQQRFRDFIMQQFSHFPVKELRQHQRKPDGNSPDGGNDYDEGPEEMVDNGNMCLTGVPPPQLTLKGMEAKERAVADAPPPGPIVMYYHRSAVENAEFGPSQQQNRGIPSEHETVCLPDAKRAQENTDDACNNSAKRSGPALSFSTMALSITAAVGGCPSHETLLVHNIGPTAVFYSWQVCRPPSVVYQGNDSQCKAAVSAMAAAATEAGHLDRVSRRSSIQSHVAGAQSEFPIQLTSGLKEGVILPGSTASFAFSYRAVTHGTHVAYYELLTDPAVPRSNSVEDRIIVRVRGISRDHYMNLGDNTGEENTHERDEEKAIDLLAQNDLINALMTGVKEEVNPRNTVYNEEIMDTDHILPNIHCSQSRGAQAVGENLNERALSVAMRTLLNEMIDSVLDTAPPPPLAQFPLKNRDDMRRTRWFGSALVEQGHVSQQRETNTAPTNAAVIRYTHNERSSDSLKIAPFHPAIYDRLARIHANVQSMRCHLQYTRYINQLGKGKIVKGKKGKICTSSDGLISSISAPNRSDNTALTSAMGAQTCHEDLIKMLCERKQWSKAEQCTLPLLRDPWSCSVMNGVVVNNPERARNTEGQHVSGCALLGARSTHHRMKTDIFPARDTERLPDAGSKLDASDPWPWDGSCQSLLRSLGHVPDPELRFRLLQGVQALIEVARVAPETATTGDDSDDHASVVHPSPDAKKYEPFAALVWKAAGRQALLHELVDGIHRASVTAMEHILVPVQSTARPSSTNNAPIAGGKGAKGGTKASEKRGKQATQPTSHDAGPTVLSEEEQKAILDLHCVERRSIQHNLAASVVGNAIQRLISYRDHWQMCVDMATLEPAVDVAFGPMTTTSPPRNVTSSNALFAPRMVSFLRNDIEIPIPADIPSPTGKTNSKDKKKQG